MSEGQSLADAPLPVHSFMTAAPHLRRPFTAQAVRWKVQTGTLVVPYIDARLVTERLNLVCPQLWHDEYEPVPGSKDLLCRLTVDGITRIDTGGGYAMLKGNYSDAFKRAAVKFGIGVSLYALPKLFLSTENGHLKQGSGKSKSLQLTDKGLTKLREGYAKWLKETGEPMFGPVLDHGDVEGAIGDPEAEAQADPAPASDQPQPLTDEKAVALTEAVQSAWDELSAEQRKATGFPTKAALKRAIAAASHDELSALGKRLADA